jgi:hypothetical protein
MPASAGHFLAGVLATALIIDFRRTEPTVPNVYSEAEGEVGGIADSILSDRFHTLNKSSF